MQNPCGTNVGTEKCCGEHRRQLELFCQKDETFICTMCVPRHSRHSCVFLHEAVNLYKDKVELALTSLESKVKDLKCLQNKKEKETADIQEDALFLEQYIRQELAKLDQFLQGKEQKLTQQLKNEATSILRAKEENLEGSKPDIIASHVAVSDTNLEFRNKEAEIPNKKEKSEYSETDFTTTQETLSDNNVELIQQQPVGLLVEDVFCLEQHISQEFAKLHHLLQDKEQKLIQQRKSEAANSLKEMRKNLPCTKTDNIPSHVAVSDYNCDFKNKEAEILKEKKEKSVCLQNNIIPTCKTLSGKQFANRKHKPIDLLTVPKTFEEVAVTFSEEEWKMLTKEDKELHREVMVQNYETLISVGFKIPKRKLLLLIKAGKDVTEREMVGKSAAEQKFNLKANLHSTRNTEYSVSCSQRTSLGTSQLQRPAENLQQSSQCAKSYKKSHLPPVLQSVSRYNCRKSAECDTTQTALALKKNDINVLNVLSVSHIFSVLQRHNAIHAAEKPYKCSQCSKGFTCLSSLRRHNAVHTGENRINVLSVVSVLHSSAVSNFIMPLTPGQPYKCTECTKSFIYKSQLKYHQITHTEERPYKCTECSKCFAQLRSLQKHNAIHLGDKPYKCAECSKSFLYLVSLRNHRAIHTGEKLYKCTECSKCFVSKSHLKCHQNTHTGMKYKCAECSKCFTYLSSLRKHEVIHTGWKPYKCAECNKCFSEFSNLRRHQVIHTGQKPYTCAECNKCFTSLRGLRLHNIYHTGESQYKCAECNKCFTRSRDLQEHNAIHTGEKPYKCAECGKCFRQMSHLIRHRSGHTGNKPYKCTECSKCFTHSSYLRKHTAIHTGEKPYKCTECGKCFRQTTHLKRHQTTHTGKAKGE
ncbi:zinc finger protein 431-like [Protopterus annectens]|uniref:zinc finger protein 431-like n=1 Tax=Protopterus annectens TaxID=7888 RepID=UPI001CFB3F5B|nr:zinc finger protein 431-like [Protopterus annectens]